MSMKQELSIIRRARCRRSTDYLTVYEMRIGDVLRKNSITKIEKHSFTQIVISFCNVTLVESGAKKLLNY